MVIKFLIKIGALCDHDYKETKSFIGGTGEKNVLSKCLKCGKTKWVSK